MYYVYGHYTKDTDSLFYIGKGSRNRAWYFKGRNNLWNKIVTKHGIVVKILVAELTPENAAIQEILAIKELKPRANFTKGGDGTVGYKHTKEAKLKMAVNKNKFGKQNHKSKTVYCSNGQEYVGVREAARVLNLDYSKISKVCRGLFSNYNNLKFWYKG
jgi:hypothetical protein